MAKDLSTTQDTMCPTYSDIEGTNSIIVDCGVWQLDDDDWLALEKTSNEHTCNENSFLDDLFPLPDCPVALGLDGRWGRADYHLPTQQLHELQASVRSERKYREARDARDKERALKEQRENAQRIVEENKRRVTALAAGELAPKSQMKHIKEAECQALRRAARLLHFRSSPPTDNEKAKVHWNKPMPRVCDRSTMGARNTCRPAVSNDSMPSLPKGPKTPTVDDSAARRLDSAREELVTAMKRAGNPIELDALLARVHARAIEKGERSPFRGLPGLSTYSDGYQVPW